MASLLFLSSWAVMMGPLVYGKQSTSRRPLYKSPACRTIPSRNISLVARRIRVLLIMALYARMTRLTTVSSLSCHYMPL